MYRINTDLATPTKIIPGTVAIIPCIEAAEIRKIIIQTHKMIEYWLTLVGLFGGIRLTLWSLLTPFTFMTWNGLLASAQLVEIFRSQSDTGGFPLGTLVFLPLQNQLLVDSFGYGVVLRGHSWPVKWL